MPTFRANVAADDYDLDLKSLESIDRESTQAKVVLNHLIPFGITDKPNLRGFVIISLRIGYAGPQRS